MAWSRFPRRFSRRSRRWSGGGRPSFPRNVARKRSHWAPLYDDLCEDQLEGVQDQCPRYYQQFVIMDPAVNKLAYQDNVSVVRIDGDIHMSAGFATAREAALCVIEYRWGLFKSTVDAFNVFGQTPQPFNQSEWAETLWISRRRKRVNSPGRFSVDASQGAPWSATAVTTYPAIMAGCCSTKVGDAVPGWALATGTGAWTGYVENNINCVQCTNDEFTSTTVTTGTASSTSRIENAGAFHTRLNLSSSKRIRVRENEILSWFIAAEVVGICTADPVPVPTGWCRNVNLRARFQV